MVPFYRRSMRHKRWAFVHRFLRNIGLNRRAIRVIRNGRNEIKDYGYAYDVGRVLVSIRNAAPYVIDVNGEVVAVPVRL